jgi:cell division protein FtsW
MKDFFKDFSDMISDIPNQAKKRLDRGVVVLIFFLICFGLIMIWSASMYNAKLEGDEFYYVRKQLIYAAAGFGIMYFVSLIDYKFIKKYVNLIMGFTILLLVIVMFLPETEGVNGAVRWINIGGIVIQPSEIAKIAVLLFLAKEIEKRIDQLHTFKGFLLLLVFCGAICGLIFKQPALSTSVVVAGLIIGMYFIAGGNLLYIVSMVGVAGVAVYVLITSTDWRMDRLLAYLDPWSDLLGSGWQPAQSLMALGSGGIFGVGIGNGRAKLMFLPEPQNDYIFAIIGEELGLLGCVAVILVYFLLVFRLIKISFATTDVFSRMVTAGMALLLAIQVFINIAVVTNLIPSTGITLPFISAGGSSLISLMVSMGIVLNISRNQKKTQ